ncbi:YaaC family protein [Ferdinandcohnia quinoae]|uniref:YaaC family protein n=1 Tax=Fredinandcohnia quinoae TaxID=2918902 RepID=UPI003D672489
MLDHRFIWQSFNALHAANTTQRLLYKCYKKAPIQDAEKKSYENSYPFIYYLEHGQNYYKLAENAPLSIKPVLLFYGMVQLLKACLLTVDPQYPESTSVLAHGVSTRKRKKQSYEFFHDEVKVQKNGLFSHFSNQMFHIRQIEGEKLSMGQLLKRIPELHNLFSLHFQKDLYIKTPLKDKSTFIIPNETLDAYHMTSQRLLSFIESTIPFGTIYIESEEIFLSLDTNSNLLPLTSSPLLFHLYEGEFYLPRERELLTIFPEVMVHYLILYNLSMISRYETEWWSELLHTYSSNDYPFIRQFLAISADKVPYLLYLFLKGKIKGD